MSGGRFMVVVLGALLGAACAHDTILPVDTVCGDGVQAGNEQCDIQSPGCVQCKIVEGWNCGDTTCTPICGDGIVVGDEECDPPDGTTCNSSCRLAAQSRSCDMTGWWVARETDFSVDEILSQVQTSSNWYLYHFSQTGDAFQVVESIDCGIHVTGTVAVDLDDGGVRGLLWKNDMSDGSAHGPRKGTFKPDGDNCTFTMDRWYNVRGVLDSLLPADFTANPDLSTLTPLPYEDNPEWTAGTPHGQHLDGAEDTDGNGIPGILWLISGNAGGQRDTAQRDWNEYFTDPAQPIPAKAGEFVAGCNFNNQENILHVGGCGVLGCGVLLAGSHPAPQPDRVTFRYLGPDLSDANVSAVVVAPIRKSLDDDMQTCANVRAALPHDPSKK